MRFISLLPLSLVLFSVCHAQQSLIEQMEPGFFPIGKGGELVVELKEAASKHQITITPGGPYEKARVEMDEVIADLSFASGQLYVPQGERLQILNGELELIHEVVAKGEIQRIAVNGELVALAGDGWLELRDRKALKLMASKSVKSGEVNRVVLLENAVAMLVNHRELLFYPYGRRGDFVGQSRQMHVAESYALSADDGYLYLSQGEAGIEVVDVAGWKRVARYNTSGYAQDIWVDKGVAYVADGDTGLTVLSVADIEQIQWLNSFNKIGNISRLIKSGNKLLAVNKQRRLAMFDVSKTDHLMLDSVVVSDAIDALGFSRGQVYASRNNVLLQLDFSEAAIPPINTIGMNMGGTRRMSMQGDHAFVADWFSGVHVYDISEPENIKHVANYHTPGSAKGTLIKDHYLFVGDDDQGLQVVDIQDLNNMFVVAAVPTVNGLSYTMKRRGNTLFLADHRGGFDILDISDPTQPKLLSRNKTPGKSWAVAVRGDVLYVADDGTGVLVFDVSDLRAPREINRYKPGGHAEDIVLRGDYAFVTFFDGGLHILDISEPTKPTVVSQLAMPGNARGVSLHNNLAYVANWHAGMVVVDIEDLSRPTIIGHLDTDGSVWGVEYRDDHVVLLDWWGGFKIADVSDPTSPFLVSRYQSSEKMVKLASKEHYLFAASGKRGLQIFDIKNPTGPIWQTGVDLSGEATDVVIVGGKAYVALREKGLAVIEVANPLHARLQAELNVGEVVQLASEKGQLFYLLADGGLYLHSPTDKAGGKRLAKDIRTFWVDGGHLYLQTAGNQLLSSSVDDLVRGMAVQRIGPSSAELIRAADGVVYGYIKGQGIAVWKGKRKSKAMFPIQHEVVGMFVREGLLYLSTTKPEMMVLKVTQSGMLDVVQVYPSAEEITDVVVNDRAAFFAGGTVVASTPLMSAIRYRKSANKITAALPADLPEGSYHVKLHGKGMDDGYIHHNAFKVGIRRTAKPKMSAKEYLRLLEKHSSKVEAK